MFKQILRLLWMLVMFMLMMAGYFTHNLALLLVGFFTGYILLILFISYRKERKKEITKIEI